MMTVSGDGTLLASASGGNMGRPRQLPQIMIWDIEANKSRAEWEWKGIGAIAIAPDKKTLAVGSDQIYLFDLGKK